MKNWLNGPMKMTDERLTASGSDYADGAATLLAVYVPWYLHRIHLTGTGDWEPKIHIRFVPKEQKWKTSVCYGNQQYGKSPRNGHRLIRM